MKQSLVRHLLTSLGSIAMMTGVNKAVPVITFLLDNLDPMWSAGTLLGGAVVTVFGYLFGRKK